MQRSCLQPSPTCVKLPICSVRYRPSRVTVACIYGTAVTYTLENRFFSAWESLTLAFGYRLYGRPSLATAGLLVVKTKFGYTKTILYSFNSLISARIFTTVISYTIKNNKFNSVNNINQFIGLRI